MEFSHGDKPRCSGPEQIAAPLEEVARQVVEMQQTVQKLLQKPWRN